MPDAEPPVEGERSAETTGTEPREPIAVLDASALMAHLNDEPGAESVREAMRAGVVISAANWAEVLSKAASVGDDPTQLASELRGALVIEPLTDLDGVEIGRLRPLTKGWGLSLADRACLALAKRLKLPVKTADSIWRELDLGVTIESIR